MQPRVPFDDQTLEGIAELICGDEGPRYLKGWELTGFFQRCGLACPAHDGTTRRYWAFDRLREYQRDGADLMKVLLRIADPREYRGDRDLTREATEKLNGLLAAEGYQVVHRDGRPTLQAADFVFEPAPTRSVVSLPDDLEPIVQDSSLADILNARLEEARRCREGDAHLAAVVMLGSVLVGVLFALVQRFPALANQCSATPKGKDGKPTPSHTWSLSALINVAHSCGWIEADVKAFSHALREYRNLVHPYQQRALGQAPDEDTCRICWEVTAAALNDLARVSR